MQSPFKFIFVLVWVGLAWSACGLAQSGNVFILIDDVGTSRKAVDQVMALPVEVGVSILPQTPYARYAAEKARAQKRTVFLHAPMEALHHNELLGPGAIFHTMPPWRIWQILDANLASVPGVTGINHHMGSRLSAERDSLFWVMAWAKWHNLIYLDSRTTAETVVPEMAVRWNVRWIERHVFLDHTLDEAAIHAQIDRLFARARKQGITVAIGHPHPMTLRVLRQRLQCLPAHVRLTTIPFIPSKTAHIAWPHQRNTIPASGS